MRPFTTQNMKSEMAMDLCIDEKDEERESDAQPAVRVKLRGGRRGAGNEQAGALSPPAPRPHPPASLHAASLTQLAEPRSLALHLSRRCKGPEPSQLPRFALFSLVLLILVQLVIYSNFKFRGSGGSCQDFWRFRRFRRNIFHNRSVSCRVNRAPLTRVSTV